MTEGKKHGMTGTEIADTVEAVFSYLQETKADHPALLDAINQNAADWRARINGLRGADQQTLDGFTVWPAAKRTVETWQDKHASTDCEALLRLDAHLEQLDGVKNGPAQQLIDKIETLADTKSTIFVRSAAMLPEPTISLLMPETQAYIDAVSRHPLETFIPPKIPSISGDAFHYVYNSHNYPNYHVSWLPSDDMRTVTASVPIVMDFMIEHEGLAKAAASSDMVLKRGGITPEITVQLGKTYGENSKVLITLTMDDYVNRYIPITEGRKEIDTGMSDGTGNRTIDSKPYKGYQPGKEAFFYKKSLWVSSEVMEVLQSDKVDGRLKEAKLILDFLRKTGFVEESVERLPVEAGRKRNFIKIMPVNAVGLSSRIHKFNGTYFTDIGLNNEISKSQYIIEAAVNGRKEKHKTTPKSQRRNLVWFEHKGNFYIPHGAEFEQIALHMEYTYGIGYRYSSNVQDFDTAAMIKAEGHPYKIIIKTNELDPGIRETAMADLNERLAAAKKSIESQQGKSR